MRARPRKSSLGGGFAILLAVLSFCAAAQAATKYKVLHAFTGADGSGPWGGVAFNRWGSLYGATPSGGNMSECNSYGCGVVFELRPDGHGLWTESVLHAFGSSGDGTIPYGGVTLDSIGNIYGTTTTGGAHNYGTIFKLTNGSAGWAESLLYSFDYLSQPVATLAMDHRGNLYGTTPKDSDAYELTPSSDGWEELVLHDFTGENGDGDGYDPYAGVILDGNGDLYGTTQYGGIQCGSSSCGIVYELSPTSGGWSETVLHRFDNNGKDGQWPSWGALSMDSRGNLYGTTAGGGSYAGVVYKLMPKGDGHWKETILYQFRDGNSGYEPNAGVIMDKAGNLYGTTDYGGVGCGVIYKLAPGARGKWRYTVLHTFGVGSDGCIPEGNLATDKKGNLYGGTVLGGTTGNGVIFEITP
jgi:uncharacterized repeat protein (TIGR03803 family)